MILILTEPDDPHAAAVMVRLQRHGERVAAVNPGTFPRETLTVTSDSGGGLRLRLGLGKEEIDLDYVSAVWYRRPSASDPSDSITDSGTRHYVTEECKHVLRDIWETSRCRWLPAPPEVIARAEFKLAQLRLAHEIGFVIPPTLLTNAPEELLSFFNRHNGHIVTKLAGPTFFRTVGDKFSRYTEPVSFRDLTHIEAVRLCPVLAQAYVPKTLELRITVVENRVFAAAIHSQDSNHTRHDWRRYDHDQTRYSVFRLPARELKLCRRLVRSLHLSFAAIDMIVTPDDQFVFLEVNPNGQYLWIEDATGLPISDAICDLLGTWSRIHNSNAGGTV